MLECGSRTLVEVVSSYHQVRISGRVTTQAGDPVEGVAVNRLRGIAIPVGTDSSGYYELLPDSVFYISCDSVAVRFFTDLHIDTIPVGRCGTITVNHDSWPEGG